jgi:peroxiredoxin
MAIGSWTRRAAALAAIAAAAFVLPATGVLAGGDGETPAGGTGGADKPKEGGDAGKPEEKPAPKPGEGEKPKEAADRAPAFTLKDVDGKERSLADFKEKIVVLEWTNHGCPFVKKHYDSGNMQALQRKYTGKGVVWLTICSSAEGKQGHMTEKEWKEKNAALKVAATAVLLDADGTVGRAYKAAVTPHMFVLAKDHTIAYRGAIDDKATAKAEDVKTAKNHVAEALDALLAGKAPETRSAPPYG